jgi:serine/threonine protein kinase
MSAAGQILNGRYRMERQVGSGGFAEVYLATDLGPLGRRVAVKLLHAHLVQQRDFLARFKQEAAMLAQLKHSHILDVYDFGEAGGTIYLVMPYIPGGTLDDLLRTARYLEPARVARYLQQIAGALDYAHSRRIVHRDLKPGNFLLDEGDSIQLSDFGIAKMLQEATQAYSGMGIMGTIPYMAPESFKGQTGPALDIYALGCIVFQLLTGATPFTGSTEQLMYAHSFEPAPSPADRAPGRIPPALGPVITRALAKRPEDRYATAGEFAQAFEAVVRNAPTVAMPPRPRTRRPSLTVSHLLTASHRSVVPSPRRLPTPTRPPMPRSSRCR